jgi:regulator of sigma E protease
VYSYGEVELHPKIGTLEENGPAARSGMQPGDLVLAVNGVEIQNWQQLADRIAAGGGASLRLDVARGGRGLNLAVTPAPVMRKNIFGEEEPGFRVGIRAAGEYLVKKPGFFEAAITGVARSGEMLALTWKGMVKLVQRVVPLDQMGGPIMIAQMVGKQAQENLEGVLALTALISINLAVLNLLPIPVLDGGHILFFTLETLMRRPLNRTIRNATTRLGFTFLICLMLLATFNDIWRHLKTD